jgi:serine/threonine protein kinase
MSNSPRNSRPRYQKIRELGHNREGGRVTYLAKDNATGQPVVIKQFQFAQSGSDWAGFKAYEREIQILRSFNHPGIPRYLNSFETPKGFCMVQEYKEAESLAVPRQWTPEQIKQIAISVLDILIYLQNRIPPVFHRDIKPENILVDDQMNVYLVDFGFARIGSAEVAMSSVAAGTFGFMAPEQIYNRELSNATDLYALGATLICLLTQTKSTEVETLLDDTGRFNFKPKVSKLNRGFINWLEKMVQPKQKDRYASAAAAKEALIPLSFNVVPEVNFSQSSLEFKATKLGEKVTQTIAVSNPIPKTVLKGRWEVAPHPNDPPHNPDSHAWISFAPTSFEGNQVECSIRVDTKNLIANKVYTRQILLQTNSEPQTHTLTVEVQTGSFHIKNSASLASLIISNFIAYLMEGSILTSMFGLQGYPIINSIVSFLIGIFVIIFGLKNGCQLGRNKGDFKFVIAWVILIFIDLLLNQSLIENSFLGIDIRENHIGSILLLIIAYSSAIAMGYFWGFLVQSHEIAGFSNKFSVKIAIWQIGLGFCFHLMSIILAILFGSFGFFIAIVALVAGIILWINMVSKERKKLINDYRKSEPNRIQP